MKIRKMLSRALSPLTILAVTTLNSTAAIVTWNGGGAPNGSWSTAANWGGATPPVFSSLVFDGNTQTLSTNNLAANTTFFNGITFAASAGAFTLYGNKVQLYGATNDNTIGIANNSASTQTVNLDLFIGPGLNRFTNAPGGSLALNGTLTTGVGVAWFGSGTFISTGLSNEPSGLIYPMAGSVLFGNTGTAGGFSALAAMNGGTISAYSYPASAQITSGAIGSATSTTLTNLELIVSNSPVRFPLANLLGDNFAASILVNGTNGSALGTAVIQIGSNSPTGRLRLGTRILPNPPVAQPAYVGGIYVPNPGTGTVQNVTVDVQFLTAGPTSSSVGGTIILGVNGTTTNPRLVVNAAIIDSGVGQTVAVRKAGNGAVAISGANSYSGGTWIDDGYLEADLNNSLGTAPVYIFRSASLFLNASGPWTNDFFLSPGTGAFNGGALTTEHSPSGQKNVTGHLTLMGAAVTNSPGDRIVGSTNGPTVFTGKITGGGTLELFSGTNNTTAFVLNNPSSSASNDWTGGLLINAAGSGSCMLSLGANNQLASNNVTLLSSGGVAQLNLSNFSDTIGSLSSAVSAQIQVTAFTSVTLTLGAKNASGDFGGQITGLLNLSKIGTGTQTYSGTSSTTAATTVNSGKWVLNGSFTSVSSSMLTKTGSVFAGTGTLAGTAIVGGGVSPGDDNAVGTLTVGTLVLSNATVTVDLKNGTSDRLAVTHNLTAMGTNRIQTVPVTTNLSSGQQITIITYGGSLTGNSNNFALLPPPAGYSFSIVDPLTTPGAIKLSVDAVPPKSQPAITNFSLLGTNLFMSGTNAVFGGTYYVLMSTNVALPLTNWTVKSSNLWIGSGNFTFNATNAVVPGAPQQFYILQVK